MNKQLATGAFVVGLAVLLWIGTGYLHSPLALVMTLCMAVAYIVGALELRAFHQASAGLARALGQIPAPLAQLDDWLADVPPRLQSAVRLRIEGERHTLPGPALTPYLVGLLVLLGMLGTFLGMVVTLNGAVLALENTTDLESIRRSLAAPVKGLGFAFGTSVAGVAASAMLGLLSTLCRRERLDVAQRLDEQIASVLRPHSRAYQREASFLALQQQSAALQEQSAALPRVLDTLQAVMCRLEQQNQDWAGQFLASQTRFHHDSQAQQQQLHQNLAAALQQHLAESAHLAGATIQPLVEHTLHGLSQSAAALQDQLGQVVEAQLQGIASRFEQSAAHVTRHWEALQSEQLAQATQMGQTLAAGLAAQQHSLEQGSQQLLERLEQRYQTLQAELAAQHASLLHNLGSAQKVWQAELRTQDESRLATQSQRLEDLASQLQASWQTAAATHQAQQSELSASMEKSATRLIASSEQQATALIDAMQNLLTSVAEAPRAVAELMGELRQELAASLTRDNQMLAERQHMMSTLASLLDTLQQAAEHQRSAIDALVSASSRQLQEAGSQFEARLASAAAGLEQLVSDMAGSAAEVASLGEAFGGAVADFSQANDKLSASLTQIEARLSQSMQRSDEQLAYYVAQAREIIDLSLLSQERLMRALQEQAVPEEV